MVDKVEVGDLVFITYKDGEKIRRAKGIFQSEDNESVTISLDNYILRIFKNAIFKIEKPKNYKGGTFDY